MSTEEESRKPKVDHQLGCDLTAISADELRYRITLLETEIGRIKAEVERKQASRQAADSLFGPKV
jgi:uncharacterized small protein (DUF1192 family)